MRPRFILIIAACGLFAQQPDPTIRLDVRQVLVPVIVTDKKGHHVSGLHASDFQILEDGVPQKIAAFSSDTSASVDDIAALGKPGAAGPRRTYVICLDTLHIAPAHAARVREALESLFEKEKAGGVQGDVQYVLIGIGRQLQVIQAATTNPLAVLLKIRGTGFQSMMGGMDASALSAEINNLKTRMDEFCRRCACGARSSPRSCNTEIDTLKQSVDSEAAQWNSLTSALVGQFTSVVEELAKLPTSRTMILVSSGFDVNPVRDFYSVVASYLPNSPQFRVEDSKDIEPGLRDALKTAAARNIIIDAVDSRGGAMPSLASTGEMDASGSPGNTGQYGIISRPSTPVPSLRTGGAQSTAGSPANPFSSERSGEMDQLARETGGVYFHEGGDLSKEFRAALADGREYYVLAYVPTNSAQDGKFRRITVENSDKRLSLRTKTGYWAVAQ